MGYLEPIAKSKKPIQNQKLKLNNMKSFSKLFITFCATAFLFSSCSKQNEAGRMVPKDAMFVFQVNTKSLKTKLTWDDIKQTSWYIKAMSDSSAKPWMKKILDDPGNSGMDMDEGLMFFVEKNALSPNGIFGMEGSIKNESDFSQFNKNLDSTGTIKTDGGINMLSLKGEGIVGWDSKHFAYVFDASEAQSKINSMNPMGNQGNNMAPLVDKNEAMSAAVKNLFNLKSDESLSKNEKFADLLKEPGDMHAWINTEEIMKGSSSLGMLGMLKLDVFFKDNIGTYTVNFDNGKIDITHKGYAGKELLDFMNKYKGGSINTGMIKSIPSQNIFGLLALNFQPEGVRELIKLIGLDGMVNSYSDKIGFTLNDFVKANKGDLVLAASDFAMNANADNNKKDEENSVISSRPDLNILFSVSIGDKASFQKLLDAGKQMGGAMRGSDSSIHFGQNDRFFAISNRQQFLNDYLAGNANNKFDFLDKLSGHPIGMYIDIHKILTEINNSKQMSGDASTIMNESLKLWNNVYVTSGDIKDGAIVGNTEINFMDQNTNSLKQLNHYFDQLSTIAIAKMASEKSGMSATDSLMIPPPIDTVGHK